MMTVILNYKPPPLLPLPLLAVQPKAAALRRSWKETARRTAELSSNGI